MTPHARLISDAFLFLGGILCIMGGHLLTKPAYGDRVTGLMLAIVGFGVILAVLAGGVA